LPGGDVEGWMGLPSGRPIGMVQHRARPPPVVVHFKLYERGVTTMKKDTSYGVDVYSPLRNKVYRVEQRILVVVLAPTLMKDGKCREE
jgi:hypothetical protein